MSNFQVCLKDPKWIIWILCYVLVSSQARVQVFRKEASPATKIPPFVETPEDFHFGGNKPVGIPLDNQNISQSLDQNSKIRVPREFGSRVDRQGTHGGHVPPQQGTHGGHVPPQQGPILETILFKVAAVGLPSTDPFGNEPDPFIQIHYSNGNSSDWVHLVRTTTLMDVHEARWNDTIAFEKYVNGTGQKLRFEIRDHDVADFDDRIGFAYIDLDRCVKESRNYRTETMSCHALISNDNGLLYISLL